MTKHIAKCMKCSDQIKSKYLNDIRLKQKKVQTELAMEEDMPENLPVQDMETGEKYVCQLLYHKLQLSHSFTPQAVVEAEVGPTNPKFGDYKQSKYKSERTPSKQLHSSSTWVPFTPQKNKIASCIFSNKMTNENIVFNLVIINTKYI